MFDKIVDKIYKYANIHLITMVAGSQGLVLAQLATF